MKTVNSISGGKTSAYIYANYPADIDIFALVCVDDPKCAHPDKKVMQLANDKLNKYGNVFGEFIGTAEDYRTVKVVLDLEQKYGREIVWVRGKSFDQIIREKKFLPNQQKRFCTHLMKVEPIFWYLYLNTDLPVKMRVGYRADELNRVEKFTKDFRFSKMCNNYGQMHNRWETLEYREGDFVLIQDLVFHWHIVKFWQNKNIYFPEDSNCQNCFWKQPQQLRKNFDNSPNIMNWAKNKEIETGRTFLFDYSMEQIEQMSLQLDFVFGTGSGCQAGFCHD